MEWSNGIIYIGQWKAGKYHGYGAKLYSKGGGYVGDWVDGKRHGWGTSLYDGKWGYDRWEGPFVDDKPHGKGTMYSADERVVVEFELFDRDGVIDVREFRKHFGRISEVVGNEGFPRQPDQRPVFEFFHGKPVAASPSDRSSKG